MRFGIHLPNSGGGAVSPDSLADFDFIMKIGLEAEKLNYHSIWANEHATLPVPELPRDTKFFEPITTLSALATVTMRIVLGSAIVILPFRDPFVLAKEISTLGVISGARFVFGVGPGRFEREYSTQGKSWKERTRKMEEQIRLIQELLTGEKITFDGEYYHCKDFSISPVPKKLPIILGGATEKAILRATRICNGLMPGHITPEEARNIKSGYIRELENQKKKSSNFTFYAEIILSIENSNGRAQSKFEDCTYVKKIPYAAQLSSKALIGTPEEVILKIKDYDKAGVEEFILILADESLEGFLNSMRLFSNKVMPKFT